MNAHHHSWDSEANMNNNQTGKIIYKILTEKENICLATPPNLKTHTDTSNAKTSTIDLCLNAPHLLPKIKIKKLPDLGSDHYPILIRLAIGPDKMSRGKRSKWIQHENNWTDWKVEVIKNTTAINTENINEDVLNYNSSIIKASEKTFKKTSNRFKEKYNKPWWNAECAKATALRRRAKRRMEKVKSRGNINEYKRLNAIAIRTHKEHFRNFWSKYLSTINHNTPIKEVWNMVKRMKGNLRPRNTPLLI